MNKSDSFFIRASITGLTGGIFGQTSIDLGAYVDALGKSVLRLRNIAVSYNFQGSFADPNVALATSEARGHFQLTTQSQTASVSSTNKSVISSGQINATNTTAVANAYDFFSDNLDIAPQMWTNGYLIGVEQIYLGGQAVNFSSPLDIEIVMECTVETLSQSAAMALALSQQ